MSFSCRNTRVSYAQWRLQSFRALIVQTELQPSINLNFFRCSNLRWSPSRATRSFASDPPRRHLGRRSNTQSDQVEKSTVADASQPESAVHNSILDPQIDEKQVTRGYKSKQWTIFSKEGQEDLSALSKQLGTVAETLDQTDGAEPLKKASDMVLESPLVRRMRQKNNRPHKRRGSKIDDEQLQNNPWAQLLASPPRICNATAIRVPRRLIVPWTMLKNPKDEKIYLMPAQLADLDAYRDLLKSARADRVKIKVEQGYRVKIGILPFQPLLRHLTSIFLVEDRPGGARRVTKQMMKLFSGLVAKAVIATKKQMQRTGATQPSPDLGLEWQQDIDKRVLSIMQQRVVMALENLVKLQDETSFDKARGVQLPVLYRSHLESIRKKESERSETPSAVDNDRDSILQDLAGGIILHLSRDGSGRTEELDLIFNNKKEYVPPSLRASRTSQNIHLTWTYHQKPRDRLLPPLPSHPFIPHMVTISDTIRVPVFSLQHLLGPHFVPNYDVIMKTIHCPADLRNHTDQDPASQTHDTFNTAKDTDTLDPDPHPPNEDGVHMTFIHCSTPSARILIEEIWQLWRYIGGIRRDERSPTGDMLRVNTRYGIDSKTRGDWWQIGPSGEDKSSKEDDGERGGK